MSGKKKNGPDAKEADLKPSDLFEIIEQCLTARKYDKKVCAGALSEDENYAVWAAPCDLVSVNILVIGLKSDTPHLLVSSIVASLPETGILPFYRRCLELNAKLEEGNINVDGKDVALETRRPLSFLSLEEVYYKINMILDAAPVIAEQLQEEFGAVLQPPC